MKRISIFQTFYNLYKYPVWNHSRGVITASLKPQDILRLPLSTARTACYSSVEEKPAAIDIDSVLSKVNLKTRKRPKQDGNLWPQGYDLSVELRIRSKKRSFLSKDSYEGSHFAVSRVGKGEDQSDNSSTHGNTDSEVDAAEIGNPRPDPTTERGVTALQNLNARLSTPDFAGMSEKEFWELMTDLLENYYVPSRSVQMDLRKYCQHKIQQWNTDTLLRICDWWHLMSDAATFQFALHEISSRQNLQTHQLVQVFYLISFYKEVPVDVSSIFARGIEQSSMEHVGWDELSIICEGFLKCRPRIESKWLALEVLNRIQSSITKPDVYQMVTIMRFLSRSYERDHEALENVADVMAPLVHSVDFVAVPHIAAAFAKLRCYHHRMFEAVTRRSMAALRVSENGKHHFRPKDTWMLLWAYGRLNYIPPDEGFVDSLIEQLRRGERASLQFPLQHVRSLIALCFLDVYPLDLIDRAFSTKFLRACEDLNFPDVYKQLVIMDNSVSIDRPEYDGNRLSKGYRERAIQVPHGTVGYTLELRTETRSLVETIARVAGGKEYMRTTPILPHIRTPGDIEVDSSGEVLCDIPVDEHRLMLPRPLPQDSQRLAILYQLKNNYRFTPRKLLGVHVMKKRQLSRLGYKVVEVPYFEWQPLARDSERRQMRYIRQKINEAVGRETLG